MALGDLREGGCGLHEVIVFGHGHGAVLVFAFAEDGLGATAVDGQDIYVVLCLDGGIVAPPFADGLRDEGQGMEAGLPHQVFLADGLKDRPHIVAEFGHDFPGGVLWSQ